MYTAVSYSASNGCGVDLYAIKKHVCSWKTATLQTAIASWKTVALNYKSDFDTFHL